MAIDIRATVTCAALGPVIQANIADDYLQGSGLVRTRGSAEIKGGSIPAIGTTVTFSYVKADASGDTIPRSLRVISAAVDPYRQITKVELGCALTYFANRKPPTTDPNSKEENADVPCYVYNYATLPISASYVLEQCATALGLTLASNPLTNKFSVEEFDLSAGYVQVMSDLLVSENYFGMVRDGTTLEIFSFDNPAMTGPIITDADVIDLGPIGVGALAGDSARVTYTTRRLKAPDTSNSSTTSTRMWESEKIVGSRTETSYSYQHTDGSTVTVIGSFVPYTSTYSVYDSWDRLMYSVTRVLTVASEVNSRWAGDNRSIGPTVEKVTRQTVSYKRYAPPSQLGILDPLQILQTQGEAALDSIYADSINADVGLASDCIAPEKPDDYSDVRMSETETWISELELAGALSIDTYKADDGAVVGFDTVARILSSREKITYDKDSTSGITRTRTERYVAASQTIAGQQDLAAYVSQGLDTSTGSTLSSAITGLLAIAVRTRYAGAETRIRTEREYGLQKRPGQADRNNTANAKEDPAEAVTTTTWAVGSVETEATQEFTLPYAPDDVISWTALDGYTSTPSDAEEKARAFGRIQNRLLLGNRVALSLQLDPMRLPDTPFDPLYVQAAGITGQYRLNGCSWAMTGDGVIASTDALYWGAVGADPGTTDSWVPLPPGMTAADLPATPAAD